MSVLRVLPCVLGLAVVSAPGGSAQAPGPSLDRAALLDDLQRLASDEMAGRAMGTPGSARARALIVQRFAAAGLEPAGPAFERPFTVGAGGRARTGVNVVGRVPGTEQPDRVIVISAHYDHLGVRDGVIFNGANDNASGTVALVAVARHFVAARPRHTLLVAAFDGEEEGLWGSRAFVRNPPVPRAALLLNLNADMLARDPADVLYVVGTRTYPALGRVAMTVVPPDPAHLQLGHDDPRAVGEEDWTHSSDHYSFLEAGIPALYVGVEDYAQHHRATDDFDSIDADFYVAAVQTLIALVEAFDAQGELLQELRSGVAATVGP